MRRWWIHISPDFPWIDGMSSLTLYDTFRWYDEVFSGMTHQDQTKDNPEDSGINFHHQTWYWISPKKVASELETKRSAQGTMMIQSSLLSYAMRGIYTLNPHSYGVNHRGLQFVDIVEAPLVKYVVKDRSHRKNIRFQPISSRENSRTPLNSPLCRSGSWLSTDNKLKRRFCIQILPR